jgi:hypothetical protein
MAFLDKHPDFAVALGIGVAVRLDRSGPYGNIQSMGIYPLNKNTLDHPAERLLNHLGHYSNTNFGVHRTEQFKSAYQSVIQLTDIGFSELLPNCMCSIFGKTKKLPGIYLIRQLHDNRYLQPNMFDGILTSSWTESCCLFLKTLSIALSQNSTMTSDQSACVVKEAFMIYLRNSFNSIINNLRSARLRDVDFKKGNRYGWIKTIFLKIKYAMINRYYMPLFRITAASELKKVYAALQNNIV